VTLLFFCVYRVLTLQSLVAMYATPKDGTLDVQAGAVLLGALEDLVCATYLATALWGVDHRLKKKQKSADNAEEGALKPRDLRDRRIEITVRFVASWLLFALMAVPFVADLLLVRIRDMRFGFDLVKMAIHESSNAGAAEISSQEMMQGYISAVMAVATATAFAAVRATNGWADLTTWSPVSRLESMLLQKRLQRAVVKDASLEEGAGDDGVSRHQPRAERQGGGESGAD
jgi:hypothetical protein